VEELLVAALVGVRVSWFILDQTEAKKASEQTVIEEEGGTGSTPPGPPVQRQGGAG
jgi:hypothetical protein